jgi:hypothetical protein
VTTIPPAPIRPGPGRIAAIILLGPMIGTIAVFTAPILFDPPPGDLFSGPEFFVAIMSFGYMFGILPSSLAAFAYARAAPQLIGFWLRLVGCVFIGAFCGAFGVLPPIWLFAGEFTFDLSFMMLSAGAGAVALPVIALPFGRAAS